MKILKKDRIDRKLRNARKNKEKLRELRPEFAYDDLVFTFGLISFVSIVIAGLHLTFEGTLTIAFYSIIINILFFAIMKGPFLSRFKKHQKTYNKNLKNINKLIDEKCKLEVNDNYQTYFNELVQLKGKPELEKINTFLIQNIIETYRQKDKLNLPIIKNEERIDQFIKKELSNSNLIKKENIQLFKMENN